MRHKWILISVAVTIVALWLLVESMNLHRQETKNRLSVVLDGETFPKERILELQQVADRVAAIEDELIPGLPRDYPRTGVICFNAPASWVDAPITFITEWKRDGEPANTKAGEIRIALSNAAFTHEQFVYQLSHELAHVKMGVRSDNYLDETFAVAISHEVLQRLGYTDYLKSVIKASTQSLSPALQLAVVSGQEDNLRTYWSESSGLQTGIDDRAFQTVGAVLLRRMREPHWSALLRINDYNMCAQYASRRKSVMPICAPDYRKMESLKGELASLGLHPMYQSYE